MNITTKAPKLRIISLYLKVCAFFWSANVHVHYMNRWPFYSDCDATLSLSVTENSRDKAKSVILHYHYEDGAEGESN